MCIFNFKLYFTLIFLNIFIPCGFNWGSNGLTKETQKTFHLMSTKTSAQVASDAQKCL